MPKQKTLELVVACWGYSRGHKRLVSMSCLQASDAGGLLVRMKTITPLLAVCHKLKENGIIKRVEKSLSLTRGRENGFSWSCNEHQPCLPEYK